MIRTTTQIAELIFAHTTDKRSSLNAAVMGALRCLFCVHPFILLLLHAYYPVKCDTDVITGIVGEDLILPCSSDLDPETEHLIWRKDVYLYTIGIESLTPDDRISVTADENMSAMIKDHVSANLHIKGLLYSDEGNYTCIQSNWENKNVSMVKNMQILVEGPPLPVILSKDLDVDIGSDFSVHCTAFAKPEPEIKIEQYRMLDTPEIKSSSSVLRLNKTSRFDEGEYRCSASNKYATTEYGYFQVHVKRKVTSDTAQRNKVESGDDTILSCLVDGYPEPPFVTWERVDSKLSSEAVIEKRRMWDTERRHQIEVNLRIKNTVPADDGVYRCVAYDSANQILSESTAVLKVMYMGNIASVSSPQAVDEMTGVDVELECTAKGYPPPLVFWRKVGSQKSDKKQPSQGVASYAVGRLMIRNVSLENGGEYECIASNGYGQVRRSKTSIIVKTRGVPFGFDVTITSVGRYSISAQWQRNTRSTRSQDETYNVTYTELNTDQVTHTATDFTSSYQSNETFTFTFDSLLPSTAYELRVIAINSIGSTASDSIRVTTFGENCILDDNDKAHYKGNIKKSSSGKDCLHWDSSTVYTVQGRMSASNFPDGSVREASNYCRNPTRDHSGPWCYILALRRYYSEQYYVKKEYCSIPRCMRKHTSPKITWIGCVGRRCEFTTELPPEETGSTISVNCQPTDYNSYYRRYSYHEEGLYSVVYFHSSTRAQLISVNYNPWNRPTKRVRCSFTASSNKGSESDATVVQMDLTKCTSNNKKANSRLLTSHEAQRGNSNRRKINIPVLSLFGLRNYAIPYVKDVTYVKEGLQSSIRCEGHNIGNYTLSLKKDGEIIASNVFYYSSWKLEKPFSPSISDTGDKTSLSVSVTFTPEAAGTYSCELDTFPPLVKKGKVSVINECPAS